MFQVKGREETEKKTKSVDCFFFLSVQSQCYETVQRMKTLKYSFDYTKCVLLNTNDLCGGFCQMSVAQMSPSPREHGYLLNKS